MDDLMIRAFREDLVRLINGVPLPMEVKRLVLKEIYQDVSEKANASINESLMALEKKKQEDANKEDTADGVQ